MLNAVSVKYYLPGEGGGTFPVKQCLCCLAARSRAKADVNLHISQIVLKCLLNALSCGSSYLLSHQPHVPGCLVSTAKK